MTAKRENRINIPTAKRDKKILFNILLCRYTKSINTITDAQSQLYFQVLAARLIAETRRDGGSPKFFFFFFTSFFFFLRDFIFKKSPKVETRLEHIYKLYSLRSIICTTHYRCFLYLLPLKNMHDHIMYIMHVMTREIMPIIIISHANRTPLSIARAVPIVWSNTYQSQSTVLITALGQSHAHCQSV